MSSYQLAADKLLIDDRRGRKVAKINQINTIGSLGMLLAAKEKGLVAGCAIAAENRAIRYLNLSPNLVTTVLELAGEAVPR